MSRGLVWKVPLGLLGLVVAFVAFVVLGWLAALVLPILIVFNVGRLRDRIVAIPFLHWGQARRGVLSISTCLLILVIWIGTLSVLGRGSASSVPATAIPSATKQELALAGGVPTLVPAPTLPPPSPTPLPPTSTPIPPTATPLPPTATPIPVTATPSRPTPTLTAAESLDAISRAQFGDHLRGDELDEIDVSQFIASMALAFSSTPVSGRMPLPTATRAKGDRIEYDAVVDYDLGPQWDENTAVAAMAETFREFAPKVFTMTNADMLELRAYTPFTDIYGNSATDVAMKFTIRRDLALKVNWGQVDPRNFSLVLSGQSGGVYVHPALQQAWQRYAK
jgi:hypothetical protein